MEPKKSSNALEIQNSEIFDETSPIPPIDAIKPRDQDTNAKTSNAYSPPEQNNGNLFRSSGIARQHESKKEAEAMSNQIL